MLSNSWKLSASFFTANAAKGIFALLLVLICGMANAEVRIELEGTEISAARELPKVLYLVPWQQSKPDSRPLPMHSLVDDTLSPIEVDVFKRRVRYYDLTTKKP